MLRELKNVNEDMEDIIQKIDYIIYRLPNIESKLNSLFQYLIDKEMETDEKHALNIKKNEESQMLELSDSIDVFINRNKPLLVHLEMDPWHPSDEANISYSILIYGRPIGLNNFSHAFLNGEIKKAEKIVSDRCKDAFCKDHGTLVNVKNAIDDVDHTFKIIVECCCLEFKSQVLTVLNNKEAFFTDKQNIQV